MGRWTPVPVAGGSYSDDAKPWSVQDTVNYLPVAAEREGTRSPAILRQRPGYTVFANTNGSPVRGMHDAEGLRLVVAGTSLYSIHPTTGASTSLGTIPGVGRVSMAHNQIAGGVEVVIANGSSAYVWNTVTATLAQITDEGFPGAKVVDFCDGYIMFVEPFGRYWGHSDLADATSYNTLDRSEAEAQPDRIVTGAVSHREWVVFGERSTEFSRNTGGSTGTFQRINGTEAEIGAAGTHTVAKLDNTLFVVGSDGVGYRLNGYQFQRITTHAIEQAWSRCNLADAYCFTFEDHGHKVWYVSMTDGRTWGYDVATGEWHRCKSYGLDFWRMSHLVRWGGRWYGGDYTNGQIYLLDWRINHDAGEPLERERTFAVMHDGGNRVFLDAILLEFDTGKTEESTPLPVEVLPSLSLSGDLGDGDQDDAESGGYTAAGGSLPYASFTITSGTFPAGLTLANDGTWSGNRTTAGVYTWTVEVTDANGDTATLEDTSTTAATISGEILLDNPILYWKLNETSGAVVTDYSGFARHGTISGTPTQTSSGLSLTAWEQGVFLAGDPGGSPLDVGVDTGWAMEAVVTRTGTGGSAREHICGQWRSPNFGTVPAELNLMSGVNAGKPQGTFTEDNLSGPVTVAGPTAITDGVRTHLMVVRDPGVAGLGALRIYVDGSQVAANVSFDASKIGCVSNGAGFAVGGTNEVGYFPVSYGFIGKIEHVAVYDQTIAAARVLARAQALGLA